MKFKLKQGKRSAMEYDVLVYDKDGKLVFRGDFTSKGARLTRNDRTLLLALKTGIATLNKDTL